MSKKTNVMLDLSENERKNLRANKVKISEILNYAPDELETLLNVSDKRANELYALADFQQIPSIGIKFAKDLVFIGVFRIEELKGKDGALLTDEYEKKRGYKIDPCVEDQFRLAVDFAQSKNYSKNWWNFTVERKIYRSKNGYPKDRSKKSWTEAYGL